MLKKIVLGNFSSGPVDPVMADAIDFMVDRVRITALGAGGRAHLVLRAVVFAWFLKVICLMSYVLEVLVKQTCLLTLVNPKDITAGNSSESLWGAFQSTESKASHQTIGLQLPGMGFLCFYSTPPTHPPPPSPGESDVAGL